MKKRLIDLWYRLAALFVVLTIAGCPTPAVTPVIPADVPGKCSAMCEKLRGPELDCPEGQPTEFGTTCESSCEQIANLGYIWVPGDSTPDCVIRAASRNEIRSSCNVRCSD